MEPTQESQKILLVGTERNCRSVGYVLDFKDYELVEKLTVENYSKYQDYQIYICELKRKSKKLVDRRLLKSGVVKCQYLDDICRTIDEECLTVKQSRKAKNIKPQEVRKPLTKRILQGIKHPLRALWHMTLLLKERFKNIKKGLIHPIETLRKHRAIYSAKHYQYKKINQYYKKYLRSLSLSSLLLYVLRAPVNPQIFCTQIEYNLHINWRGELNGCNCANCMIPFGNLTSNNDTSEILESIKTRIIKLSSLNGSYCLCMSNKHCEKYINDSESNNKKNIRQYDKTVSVPQKLTIAFDKSCNLCCKQCRDKLYIMDNTTKQQVESITDKLLRSGWLEKAKTLKLAGNGEVFYSPYYRQLLTKKTNSNSINILSNGILFNEANWNLIASKYEEITVNISVDAATAETYKKLRGADFNVLLKNLVMLGGLRRQNKIKHFILNFVIQRENFHEMIEFVKLGHELNVDYINFQNLLNLGTFTKKEFHNQSLIIKDSYLAYELWKILQDPIFNDQIVNLRLLQRYIVASEKKYRKRYEREQRAMPKQA